ncbi:MAG: hypothetical protein PUF60_08370 [Firmicutes bacterium]|nr:hypothetical protein [Bacillota bacterium]
MAACEVSGTLAVYNCSAAKKQEPERIAIKSVKLSYTSCTYTGKTRMPSLFYSLGGTSLKIRKSACGLAITE